MRGRGFSWVEQNKSDLEDLVLSFKRARGESGTLTPCGRVLVITGAGCSASAGIPTAKQLAQECAVNLWSDRKPPRGVNEQGETLEARASAAIAKQVRKDKELKELLANQEAPELLWSKVYDYLFGKIYGQREQKRVIEEALGNGQGLNWAHACLGELMRQRFVHTVLTVNFDLLALEGAVRAGVIPAIADGFEGLSRVDGTPTHPQLVYLHGTCHSYTLRNAADQVKAILEDPEARRAVRELVRNSECILVVGYSAADSGLAVLLKEIVRDYRPKLVWTAFESQPERLSTQAREICASSGATRLLLGVDADGLFRELLGRLGLGAPQWIKEPLYGLCEAAKRPLDGNDSVVRIVVVALREQIKHYQQQPDPLGLGLNSAAHLRLADKDREAIRVLKKLRRRNPQSLEVLRALGDTLFETGRRKASATLLTEAVETLEEFLALVPNETAEEAWAQRMLGRALINLDEWEEGPVFLEKAVTAFRAALKVHTRKRFPFYWAEDQNDLGTALRALADQKEGVEHLSAAVEAFRAALQVHTCDELPDHWAMTQTNLGEALAHLGNREEGTACLEEAVSVLRAVLEVRSYEGLRAAWARTQHYLGDALRGLGNRKEGEVGKRCLKEAVAAYKEALKVRTRKQHPLYWARTQDRLGRTFASLGNRERGTLHLKRAAMAYQRALKVRSCKGPIRDRADSLCNLGDVLVGLGERREITAYDEAIVAAHAVFDLPEPISTAYAPRAQSILMKAEAALRARQAGR